MDNFHLAACSCFRILVLYVLVLCHTAMTNWDTRMCHCYCKAILVIVPAK